MENRCEYFDQCGFVRWRNANLDLHITPVAKNGNCGKDSRDCGRLKPETGFSLSTELPLSREELDIAFPDLPNENGRPPRKLIGGCNL